MIVIAQRERIRAEFGEAGVRKFDAMLCKREDAGPTPDPDPAMD